jgi:hypothetical protein
MPIIPGTEDVLEAAKAWKDRSLIGDKSVFANENLWTLPHLDELQRYFVENLDMGEGNFIEKLREQLAPVSPAAKRLAAELMWVMMLFPSKSNVSRQTKSDLIREIWSWGREDLREDEPLLHAPLQKGIGSGGRAYSTLRYAELVFFIKFLRQFKRESVDRRRNLLSDPWVFANYLDKIEGAGRRQFRHMLLHLLFPVTFERISSGADREAISEFYSSLIPSGDSALTGESATVSIDRRLASIRRALRFSDSEDFYTAGRKEWRDESESEAPPGPAEAVNAQAALERILQNYANARASEQFGGGHPIAAAFKEAKSAFDNFTPVRNRPSLQVGWSAGRGNWSGVPWIALLDTRETTTTKRGVYCVYLFRQDMSGVYLTYNQGVSEPFAQFGKTRGRQFLRDRAAQLRRDASTLQASGFQLDDRIDLRAKVLI